MATKTKSKAAPAKKPAAKAPAKKKAEGQPLPKGELVTLNFKDIVVDHGSNYRTNIERNQEFENLVESIKNAGIVMPVGVYYDPGDKVYRLFYGFRRMLAGKEAKIDKVPAMIYHDLTENQRDAIALMENEIRQGTSLQDRVFAIARFNEQVDKSFDKGLRINMISMVSTLPKAFIRKYYGIIQLLDISERVLEDWMPFEVVLQMIQYDLEDARIREAIMEFIEQACKAHEENEDDIPTAYNLRAFMSSESRKLDIRKMKDAAWELESFKCGTRPVCAGCAFNGKENPLINRETVAICGNPACFDDKQFGFFEERLSTLHDANLEFASKLKINRIAYRFEYVDKPYWMRPIVSDNMFVYFDDDTTNLLPLRDTYLEGKDPDFVINGLIGMLGMSADISDDDVIAVAKENPESKSAELLKWVEEKFFPMVAKAKGKDMVLMITANLNQGASTSGVDSLVNYSPEEQQTIQEQCIEALKKEFCTDDDELMCALPISDKDMAMIRELFQSIPMEIDAHNPVVERSKSITAKTPQFQANNQEAQKIVASLERANSFIGSVPRLVGQAQMDAIRGKGHQESALPYGTENCNLLGHKLQDWENMLLRAILFKDHYEVYDGEVLESIKKVRGLTDDQVEELDINTLMSDDLIWAIIVRQEIRKRLIEGSCIDTDELNGTIYTAILNLYDDQTFKNINDGILKTYEEKIEKKNVRIQELMKELEKANSKTPVVEATASQDEDEEPDETEPADIPEDWDEDSDLEEIEEDDDMQ